MTPAELERFEARYVTDANGSCWLWTGHIDRHGYGTTHVGRKFILAHRQSYEHHVGPIPAGMQVNHRCDVRHCVNPEHLYAGTHAQNMADLAERTSSKGERQPGAKLTDSAVRSIRARYADGGVTYAQLAAEFGVAAQTVHCVVKGRRWRHVA